MEQYLQKAVESQMTPTSASPCHGERSNGRNPASATAVRSSITIGGKTT